MLDLQALAWTQRSSSFPRHVISKLLGEGGRREGHVCESVCLYPPVWLNMLDLCLSGMGRLQAGEGETLVRGRGRHLESRPGLCHPNRASFPVISGQPAGLRLCFHMPEWWPSHGSPPLSSSSPAASRLVGRGPVAPLGGKDTTLLCSVKAGSERSHSQVSL